LGSFLRDANRSEPGGHHVTQARLGPRVRRVCLVYRDLVAVLGDDAGPYLVERVATLAASGLKVAQAAADHGSGLQG
jgi:hypothetical protein